MITRFFAAVVLCSVSAIPSNACDDKQTSKEDKFEQAEGVIVAVEPIADAKDGRVKLTVNTAAVWRDWVRDQSTAKPKVDGKTGENSIAVKGEPISPTTTIIVEIDRGTNLASRYRSNVDETNKGSRTVEQAEQKEGSAKGQDVKRSPRDDKAPKIGIKDLKVGQFVEVEAKMGNAKRLVVLMPIDAETTPKSEGK